MYVLSGLNSNYISVAMDRNLGHVNEEFLTCAICKDDYTDPRELPCLHAFCKKCISEHIVKVTKGQRAPTVFECPLCKRSVDAPDPHQPPMAWADLFPKSHLINSLMDSVRLRNDVSKCDPCFRRKDKVIAAKWCKECAEALCEQCVAFHKSLKYSQNHTLLEFEELRQQPIKNTLPRPPCPTHENTTLGFFCEDHQKVCCSSCITVDHRKCSHVTTSVDAAAKYRNEVDSLTEKLRHQNGWSARILENRQHSIKLLDDAEAQLKNQIIGIRQQFEELLRNQEKKMLEELKLLKGNERQVYEKDINKCEEMMCTTSNALNILKTSNIHGTDSDILLSVNSVKKEARICEKELAEMSKNLSDILLIFTPDRMLSQVLGTLKEIGKISFSRTNVHVQPPYNISVQNTSIDSTGSPLSERASPDTPQIIVENKQRKIVDDTPRSSRLSQQSRSISRHSRTSPALDTSRNSINRSRNNSNASRTSKVNETPRSTKYDNTPRSNVSKISNIFQGSFDQEQNNVQRNQSLLSPVTPMGRSSRQIVTSQTAALEYFFKVGRVIGEVIRPLQQW